MSPLGLIERAFQVAKECGSLAELESKLRREGYSDIHAHLGGRQIRADLSARLDPQLKAQFNEKIRGYKAAGKATHE
jgi:hypothetical protein